MKQPNQSHFVVVCLLQQLPIGQLSISSLVGGAGRGGGEETKLNGLKHACLVPCLKFPSEGTVAVAGVMTHCTEKKTLFFCSPTSMWGLSLLARKNAILE